MGRTCKCRRIISWYMAIIACVRDPCARMQPMLLLLLLLLLVSQFSQ